MKKFQITFTDEIINYIPEQKTLDYIEVEKVTLGFHYKVQKVITRNCTDNELWEDILNLRNIMLNNVSYNMSNYKKIKLINE